MSQSARLQYIIRCLDHADGVTLREIAEHFEISTRQACRDIEYLRDQMGAPIAYDHRTRRYRLTTLWESYSNVDERLIIQDYMAKIARELEHPIDKFSKPLIISNIEVLLNYCMRFYERQFITREELNNDVLVRFERLLDDYWDSGMAQLHGLPTVKYFADKVCLSPNYFGDLVKAETGRTAREHIQLKIVERAKNALFEPETSMKQVADMLGFQYPQHFLRFFKKEVGCTPKEYLARKDKTVA